MTTEVTAIYESPDLAEWALHRLRNSGIPLHSFHIQPTRLGRQNDAQSYAPTAQNSLGGSIASALASPPVWAWEGAENSYESVLAVRIPDGDAARARSILISVHGRRVR